MKISIRECQQIDCHAVHRLMTCELGLSITIETVTKQLEKMLADDSYSIFVAVCEVEIVGFVAAYKNNILEMVNPYMRLIGLCVASGYRRRKIGTQLLGQIIDYAKSNDIAYIAVNSSPNLINDHTFFKSLGFEQKSIGFSMTACM